MLHISLKHAKMSDWPVITISLLSSTLLIYTPIRILYMCTHFCTHVKKKEKKRTDCSPANSLLPLQGNLLTHLLSCSHIYSESVSDEVIALAC